jgi:hypothetical protein
MRQTKFLAISAFAFISTAACNKKSKQDVNANVAADRNSVLAQKSPFAGVSSSSLKEIIREELAGAFSSVVRGWTTGQVNKPSFEFVIENARREFVAMRDEQLERNMEGAKRILRDPYMARRLLESMERRLKLPNARGTYGDDTPELKAMMSAMGESGRSESQFVTYGVLVSIGWGSGDVEEIKSERIPRGPKGLAEALAPEIASKFASRVQ